MSPQKIQMKHTIILNVKMCWQDHMYPSSEKKIRRPDLKYKILQDQTEITKTLKVTRQNEILDEESVSLLDFVAKV